MACFAGFRSRPRSSPVQIDTELGYHPRRMYLYPPACHATSWYPSDDRYVKYILTQYFTTKLTRLTG
jgi:hypothetical protein